MSEIPGLPWHATRKSGFVSSIHNFVIAEVPVRKERKAIATLLAAAPELFSALSALEALYVRLVDSGDCGFWDAGQEPEIIAARNALAKATPPEGREQNT